MPSTISAGTTAGTAIAIAGDTSGELQLRTNGTTTAMTIDASQNVGIGTTTPIYKFQVSGANVPALINSTNNFNVLGISSSSTIGGYIGANGTNLIFGNNAGTEAMRITSGGNVGIGTTSPGDKLTIVGAPSTYISVSSTNASTGSGLFTTNATRSYLIGAGAASGNSNLEFRDVTGSATRMVLDTSGNVAIGNPSTNNRVLVYTPGAVAGYLQVANGSTGLGATQGLRLGTPAAGNAEIITDGAMWFSTGNTERMRIDSSGNVMVNTTAANGKFTVISSGSTLGIWSTAVNNHGVYGEATGTGYGVYGRAYNSSYGGCIGFDASNTVYGIIGYTTYALQTNASINVNGTIYASDGRLKENIKPIDSALNKIAQLNPVSFDWKANSTRGIINKNTPLPDYGLIAQEVESILPDIVYETQSPSLPSNTNAAQSLESELGTYKGVDYSRLIPFLTKAIQELKAELDATKAEVQALKGAA